MWITLPRYSYSFEFTISINSSKCINRAILIKKNISIWVPWISRRSNQLILKEVNPKYSLEGLMRKLKLQYFDHLMWRAHSLEKILMLGQNEGRRKRQQRRMRWLNGIIDLIDMILNKLQKTVKDRETWCAALHGITKS